MLEARQSYRLPSKNFRNVGATPPDGPRGARRDGSRSAAGQRDVDGDTLPPIRYERSVDSAGRSTERQCAVRARTLQVALDHLGRGWPAVQRDLDEALDVARIRATPAIGWLPLDDVLTLQRVLEERLGLREAARVQRSLFLPVADSPIFHAFTALSRRTMAQRPERMLPFVARGYSLFYRHCGVMHFEREAVGAATLVIRDPAPAIVAAGCWQRATASYLEGVFDLVEVDGSVRSRVVHTAAGPESTRAKRFGDESGARGAGPSPGHESFDDSSRAVELEFRFSWWVGPGDGGPAP
jgi:hypothetical protein